MKNTILSPTQLTDAKGLFDDAAANFGVLTEFLDDTEVPRPTVEDLLASANRSGVTLPVSGSGSLMLSPNNANIIAQHPGLRGIAHYKADRSMRMAPAIVLRDGKSVALLLSDANPYDVNELKHGLLENMYVTQREDIAAHNSSDRVAPAVGGHALIAASFTGNPLVAHDQVHALANGNFGTNFDAQGSRDICFGVSGHDVLRVRSAVLHLGQVVLEVPPAYQVSQGESLLADHLTASQLNVALTVAATLSSREKQQGFNPLAVMEAMSK